jgi:hypothetical protein
MPGRSTAGLPVWLEMIPGRSTGGLPVWLEILGLVAAIVVAAAAAGGIFLTARALQATERSNTLSVLALHASERSNTLSDRALHASEDANTRAANSFEASIRPLITSVNPPVTPVNHHATSCHRHHGALCLTADPSGGWVWSIPIQNAGPGVARIKSIYATGRSQDSRHRGTPATSAGVPSGEVTRIQFHFRTQAEFGRYTAIHISYEDIDFQQAQGVRILVSPRTFRVQSVIYHR